VFRATRRHGRISLAGANHDAECKHGAPVALGFTLTPFAGPLQSIRSPPPRSSMEDRSSFFPGEESEGRRAARLGLNSPDV